VTSDLVRRGDPESAVVVAVTHQSLVRRADAVVVLHHAEGNDLGSAIHALGGLEVRLVL
jgi:hypothetical protein